MTLEKKFKEIEEELKGLEDHSARIVLTAQMNNAKKDYERCKDVPNGYEFANVKTTLNRLLHAAKDMKEQG